MAAAKVVLSIATVIVAGCAAAAPVTDAPASTSTATATAPSPLAARPPDGFLTVGPSEPIAGLRGSSCWTGPGSTVCDDTPWLVPESDRSFPASDGPCAVTLDSDVEIIEWSIVAAPAGVSDPLGASTHLESRGVGRPVSEVAFGCPPAGDWVVHAFVRAQAGDVSYYWRLRMDGPDAATS